MKNKKITRPIAKLIIWATEQNYQLTFGVAYRSKEQAERNAKVGIGIKNSLYIDRLAIDFNLFIDGVYQTKSEAYSRGLIT